MPKERKIWWLTCFFIASDFLQWKSIVEENDCGICVDSTNSEVVHDVCKYLLENSDVAEEMGQRVYDAVISKYNWKNEE